MKIGILSDTHDRLERTLRAVDMLLAAGAETLFHCGDLTGPDIVRACGQRPCYYVLGNNDDDWPQLRRAMAETKGICLDWGGEVALAGKRLALTHGHLHTDVRRLLAARPDYFFFGHSHQREDWRTGQTRGINPGALHRAPEFTVATLDLQTDALEFLTVPR